MVGTVDYQERGILYIQLYTYVVIVWYHMVGFLKASGMPKTEGSPIV